MSRTELPDRAGVVVIGGGIMGTSTAFFLASETDRDVLLVEKDHVGSGSTGDSSAILRHHYGGQESYTRMAWAAHQFYRAFEDRTGHPLAYARNPMVRFGTDETREEVLAGYEVLQSLDIPTTRYDSDEFGARYPMVDTGPFDFVVSDDTAGYADGTDAANGFARAAQERGATVVTGVAVEAVRTERDAVAGVETTAGLVECDEVVVTAGPWTSRLLEPLGADVPIATTREQVLLLDPPASYRDAYTEPVPTLGAIEEGWYIRPDFGGGILLATHHTAEQVDPDHFSDTPDQETVLSLLDGVERYVPGLADAGIRGQYCGVYSTTPDHDFVIDQVGPDGCTVGCGFSGHGFKHGPTIGRILTDLVVDGQTALVDLDPFSLARFE